MRPIKCLLDVINIFNIIQKKISAKLILLGDGPDRPKAQKLSHQLGIQDKVLFLGNIFNRADYFSISDLFILPSSYESFGLSALEAMSCGCSVIITCNGGAKEMIGDKKNSLLCKPGNIKTISMQAIDLLSDFKTLNEMKRNARERALCFFSKPKILDLYEQYYFHALLNKK